MDKIFLQSLMEMHAVTLIRMKCLISALEEKGIITRQELDSAQDNLPESEVSEARARVRRLFGEYVAESIFAKP
jgi:SOS response regulatory protein OraA/RecX